MRKPVVKTENYASFEVEVGRIVSYKCEKIKLKINTEAVWCSVNISKTISKI